MIRIGTLISIAMSILLFLTACQKNEEVAASLFELKDNESIGINFNNEITSTNEFNVYKYRNFYNGGGVGLGDINNDGLIDVYLVSNQSSNKLYLNKGNFQFEDITDAAGVAGTKAWSTGVTFADVNGDGLLDIYVCNSGDLNGDDKESELFINKGNNTFEEKAKEYGLNDKGYSTHASFFDYDKDGDLDVYLLNNSYTAIGSFNLRKNQRTVRDELGGDKLLRNDGNKFVDVSEDAGIYGSEIGFGLGVTVSDFNNDSWMDIFISNDFFERDYLYINQSDGTFKEDLVNQIGSISAASMGADAADINNDGYTDIFVTDMLPYDYERLKTVSTFDDWNRYSYNLDNDYHHQFTRNVLHLNQKGKYFVELSRLMNVHASDWSWGALFFDMDNDGFRDLYIANGIYKDLTNQDYIEHVANESIVQSIVSDKGIDYKELIDIIPSNKVKNMAFRNVGGTDLQLDENLGLAQKSFSNGSAYGDLDNDGDLDLVVNNINMPCFVYENQSSGNNFIRVKLEGEGKNKFGIGARVQVVANDKKLYFENITCKGFQSTVDHRLTIGVGDATEVTVRVNWPSGKENLISATQANQELVVKESEATAATKPEVFKQPKKVFDSVATIPYVKKEKPYSDFNQERLIFWMRSNEGGKITKGDINNDGLQDLILPGAKGMPTEIWKATSDGNFEQIISEELAKDIEPEYVNADLVDLDNDGDLDLLLAAGGVEHSKYAPFLVDKIYLNNGAGIFSKDSKIQTTFPKMSSSAIKAIDFDKDGDLDILATERIKIGQCGMPCSSHLYENDGQGKFTDVTAEKAKSLLEIGMVTVAEVVDIDKDGDLDIILAGEFMPLTILQNDNGKFTNKKINSNKGISGWWTTLHLVDINNDGDLDILAGNHGTNSRFKASVDQPIAMYFSDFDKNGAGEGIMCGLREDNKYYPFALRHNLIDQMKSLKKVFPDFESFKAASIEEVIDPNKLKEATTYYVDNLETTLFINEGNWTFNAHPLPIEVQYTTTHSIIAEDFDRDGDWDIVLGGNLTKVKPELGIFDGTRGLYLENQGDLNFVAKMDELNIKGEIRGLEVVDNKLIVNVSNDSLKVLKY